MSQTLKKPQHYGTITAKDGWACCPHCGQKILRLWKTTSGKDIQLYCKRCCLEFLVNISSVPVP